MLQSSEKETGGRVSNGCQWKRDFTTLNKLLGENSLSFNESTAYCLIFYMFAIKHLFLDLSIFRVYTEKKRIYKSHRQFCNRQDSVYSFISMISANSDRLSHSDWLSHNSEINSMMSNLWCDWLRRHMWSMLAVILSPMVELQTLARLSLIGILRTQIIHSGKLNVLPSW